MRTIAQSRDACNRFHVATTPPEQPFLTVKELAELLRVSRRTAYLLVQSGQMPSVRVGGSIRIPRAALVRQLAGGLRRAN
jgi:excisionase family DNA binding protein